MPRKKNATVVGPGGVTPFTVPAGTTTPAAAIPVPATAVTPPAFPGSPQAATAALFPSSVPQSITGEVNATDFAMQLYLKGSDVPQGTSDLEVKVIGFVRIQGSRSPLIAQIEPMYGKSYLPLNKTNIKQIAGITQNNDLRCIIGRFLKLTVYPVNNPSTGEMARGLFVSGAR